MASLSDAEEEDMELLMRDYCMPTMAEMTTDSLLTKSQYAKVIFHDLLASYPTDADVWCRYSVTDGVTVRLGDNIVLFRVGWNSINDNLLSVAAPMPLNPDDYEFQIRLKAESLPKDTREFYQLCYVSVEGSVCGASVPFQFRLPDARELREVEEQGLMVVRSQTAIHADELQRATKAVAELKVKTAAMEMATDETAELLRRSEASLVAAQQDLLQLVSEKGVLSRKNEQLAADAEESARSADETAATNKQLALKIGEMAQQIADLTRVNGEMKLKLSELFFQNEEFKTINEEFVLKNAEIMVTIDDLAREKMQRDRDTQLQREWTLLHNKKMEATVQALNDEKEVLVERLEECARRGEGEAGRLRGQLDGLQQMLDVSTESKEMAAQALHAEHAKATQLWQEKRALEEELVQQARRHGDEATALDTQLRNTQLRLNALEQQTLQDRRELAACREEAAESAAAAAKLRLEAGFDPLLDDYEDMRRRAHMLAAENATLVQLRQENAELQDQVHQAAQEAAGLTAMDAENGALRAENGVLGRQVQQLRVSAALRKRRETEADRREAQLAEREADAAVRSREHDDKFAALDNENRMLSARLQEMQSLLVSCSVGSSQSVTSMSGLVQRRTNNGLEQANATAGVDESYADGTELHESPGCLDLSLTLKVMELQNQKGDAELALAEALTAEEEAWDLVKLEQAKLTTLDRVAQDAALELSEVDGDIAADNREANGLAAEMKQLQEAILGQDNLDGDDPSERDGPHQQRLDGVLRRWDAVSARQRQLESRRHDLRQDAAVREVERQWLAAAAERADAAHKEAVRAKHALLETLVTLDNRVLALTAGTAVHDALLAGQALAEERKANSEEESLVAIYHFEGAAAASAEEITQAGQAPRELPSLSTEWEFVSPKKLAAKEDAVSMQADSELCLRLELAATEYRKLFLEKARLEKRLATVEKQLANPAAQT